MARAETSGTRLLHVIATPRGLASNTGRVTSCLLEALRDDEDGLEVDTLDLFRADLPSVAGKNIETKYRLMTGQAPDEDGVLPVQRQLGEAASALREERFPAQPSSLCDRCDFVPLCPAHVSGSVLS